MLRLLRFCFSVSLIALEISSLCSVPGVGDIRGGKGVIGESGKLLLLLSDAHQTRHRIWWKSSLLQACIQVLHKHSIGARIKCDGGCSSLAVITTSSATFFLLDEVTYPASFTPYTTASSTPSSLAIWSLTSPALTFSPFHLNVSPMRS